MPTAFPHTIRTYPHGHVLTANLQFWQIGLSPPPGGGSVQHEQQHEQVKRLVDHLLLVVRTHGEAATMPSNLAWLLRPEVLGAEVRTAECRPTRLDERGGVAMFLWENGLCVALSGQESAVSSAFLSLGKKMVMVGFQSGRPAPFPQWESLN